MWRLIVDAYVLFPEGKLDPRNPLVPWPPPTGGPDWITSARYSIDAKAEGPATVAMMRGPMMRSLLEERFQLKVRHETREATVYILTVAKGGPKLRATKDGSCNPIDGTLLSFPKVPPDGKPWCMVGTIERSTQASVYDVPGITLDLFFKTYRPDGRTVINQTGLTGPFDIHLEVVNPPRVEGGASDPRGGFSPFLAAIKQQLGLQLDSGKGPSEVLLIDHVEKPSEN